ncbi:TonB family protein [Arenimonas sp.]|uniref:TonB family protein n=1 Tax=Arenimonas sp. TaxID=1872635 RepID=UPI0035B09CC2
MIAALLAAALAVSGASAEKASAGPEAGACPAPVRIQPRYPVKLARANKTGTVLVGARFDDCGRVIETRVDESSGEPLFDAAARESVARYVLSEAQRAKALDGWVQAPVKFGGFRDVVPRDVPWPRSHRKPRYLPDDQAVGFDDIAAFKAAPRGDTSHFYREPYGMVQANTGEVFRTVMAPDKADPSVFWLEYLIQPAPPASPVEPAARTITAAIARYRLVEEGGEPVVRLGILCERPADECQKLRDFLFQGLPFAKPRRR